MQIVELPLFKRLWGAAPYAFPDYLFAELSVCGQANLEGLGLI
jgi:hypothetical protein